MPETKRHLELRTLLYQVLKLELAAHATVGSEQFVYWDASDPTRCLAPDAFVRLGTPDADFDTWRTWERGAPDLAVEIVSKSDEGQATWEDKLEKYRALGVAELVRFCPEEDAEAVLAIWDRVNDDLVEREVTGDRAPCVALGLHWVTAPGVGYPRALRLARDPDGQRLLLTDGEARRAAEARIADLEAQLARRG